MTRRRPAAAGLVASLVAVAGCGTTDDAGADPTVVAVAAQPCATPNRALGLGVVVTDGVIVTAAHTVEGDLRSLTVEGAPATVVATDQRTDLALLAAKTAGWTPAELAERAPRQAAVVGPAGDRHAVTIESTGPLIVHDVTDDVRHERQVHRFSPGVSSGTSGAPVVDEQGRVLGIVVLDDGTASTGYAVTAAEVAALLAASRGPVRQVGCPG